MIVDHFYETPFWPRNFTLALIKACLYINKNKIRIYSIFYIFTLNFQGKYSHYGNQKCMTR